MAPGTVTYAATGSFDSALLGANLASLPGGLIAKRLVPCFPAGTPILTPEGHKPIEAMRVGDLVLSRDENDDGSGPLSAKAVEEFFVREGRLFELSIAGSTITTTPEHPFYVRGDGWIPAGQLQPGDLLSTSDGRWVELEHIDDTGAWSTVYNFRVSEYHTYFVAPENCKFNVWVHNTYNAPRWGVRGFSSAEQFSQAGTELAEALQKAGLKVRQTGVRGSAVTGVSSKGGGFRVSAENGLKPSDIDVFIEFADDIGLSSSQKIPGFIHPDKLLKNYPALQEWSEKWPKILGREITPGGFKPGTFNDPDVIGF